jgi:hypothetical protein
VIDDEQPIGTGDGRHIGIRVEAGRPISFESKMPANDASALGAEEARRIVRTLRTYRTALRDLVTTKYASVASTLPGFFAHVANIFILRCTDGVLVRYEFCDDGKPWTKCGSIDQSLERVAPGFSDNFIHFPLDPSSFHVGDAGPRFSMSKVDARGNAEMLCEIQPIVLASIPSAPDCYSARLLMGLEAA